MKVCVVGGDGRAHVLARVLARTADVVASPGNAGIEQSTSTPPTDLDADLFVISPEGPLVDGIADQLRAQGKLVFGPGADGARIEGSKAWMKDLLVDAGVPTAGHATFSDAEPAIAHLQTRTPPYIVKTDGLASGKGVLVTHDLADAAADVRAKLSGAAFGDAGRTVVIEDAMAGPELSVLAVTDGRTAVALDPAQDFKRSHDGDAGANTGGMGSYSPVPWLDPSIVDEVMKTAVQPTLDELVRRGIDYRGVLYCGLMLTDEGPKVVEYNCRFGDPEAQVVLPRFAGDLAAFLAEAAAGDLRSAPSFATDAAVDVVLAAEGYPGDTTVGDEISGVEAAAALPGVQVFHAGTRRTDDGRLVTAGGRILHVSALGPTLAEARRRAYEAADLVHWRGLHRRNDIAAAAAEEGAWS